jgi:predicted Fe-Mo cluster-binding NifX family protein
VRICIPTEDERGLEGQLSQHFGRTPYFTVVDDVTGEIDLVANGHAVHEHGSCAPTGLLATQRLDAVICRGLGYMSESRDVAGALSDLRAGRLSEAVSEELSCGHGH